MSPMILSMNDWITDIAELLKNLVINPWIISKIDSISPPSHLGRSPRYRQRTRSAVGENRRSPAGRQEAACAVPFRAPGPRGLGRGRGRQPATPKICGTPLGCGSVKPFDE